MKPEAPVTRMGWEEEELALDIEVVLEIIEMISEDKLNWRSKLHKSHSL
jgi:hypothetical protein